MLIQLKKGSDGPSTLACVRADGTRTWGKVHPFFPIHDLTHCAVESLFAFKKAFFGLVASGWDIDDFLQPGAAARQPVEALWAESIVGLLDLERASGQAMAAAEFDEQLSAALGRLGVPPFRAVSEVELGRVRALREELRARWQELPPGDTMEVRFPALLEVVKD